MGPSSRWCQKTIFTSSALSLVVDGELNIAIVNIARLTNTPSFLPLALYHCTNLGGDPLDGWTHEDGTSEHLSTADIKRCIDVRIILGQEQFLFSRIFDAIPLAKCSTCGQCATQLTSILLNTVRKEEMVKTPLLFDQWSPSIRATSLCEGCKQVLLERNQAERQRTWDSLPQVFEITVESWAKSGGAGAPAGAA